MSRHPKKTVIFITGMSGTGKSTTLAELARRGYTIVDTDYGGFSIEMSLPDGQSFEQLWHEERVRELLAKHDEGILFLSGCVPNQVQFYPQFDAVVLLSAPLDTILERVASRKNNPFGNSEEDREQIRRDFIAFEPLLRDGATAEIDTCRPLNEVADKLEAIANAIH
ncbi:AAA family ATPase [Sporolactobacillus shoreicorticis]|uniref:Shikimate kinase n=1 Tax=Sporolactobacillus shoreicorticis TaxID=1923877 RepID=A0ABW5S342_9BACL|nr:AAA family ATPase [Sporolactobacillus shoreicorticis]MCO7127211.1 AAA family ATPase [Sporolactobacillus shoreicorticis]